MRSEIKAKMKAKKAEIRRKTYITIGVVGGVVAIGYLYKRVTVLEEAVSVLNEVAILKTTP